MQSILVLLLTVLGAVLADQPIVNTPPSVAECLPSQVTFSGGNPPYYISVIPGGQPTAAALEDFPIQNQSPYTWVVKQPVGTSVTLQIRDSNGQINYSQQVTVQPGQTSCLGNSSSSGSSNSSATTPTNTTPTNTTTPAPVTPTTGNATATTSNGTSTTTPSTTNTSSPTTVTKGSSPFTTTPSTSSSSSTVSGSSTPAAGASNSAASSKFNAALIATVVAGATLALSA